MPTSTETQAFHESVWGTDRKQVPGGVHVWGVISTEALAREFSSLVLSTAFSDQGQIAPIAGWGGCSRSRRGRSCAGTLVLILCLNIHSEILNMVVRVGIFQAWIADSAISPELRHRLAQFLPVSSQSPPLRRAALCAASGAPVSAGCCFC